ncbi:hypothetical protein [Oceanibaculum nanhaiense]|uniref:hypothetical protein n=1 Tax=Oceanibaculum nanhaiense TaxID=1909734 RepID=UPI003F6E6B57
MENAIVTAAVSIISSLAAVAITLYATSTWRQSDFKYQRSNKIIEWSSRCLFCLSKSEHIIFINQKISSEEKIIILSEISYLIEEGRLFFNNSNKNQYGNDKFPPYRGYRPLILDFLVSLHLRILKYTNDENPEKSKEMKEYINIIRRGFLSALQNELEKGWGEKAQNYAEDALKGHDQRRFDEILNKGEEVASREFNLEKPPYPFKGHGG